ncbi:MAG: biotin--[acetyl-CoA-carboxylase] ligase [Candidatus Copromonas sp.]|nr:biotin--[acetyl-CoA-carboxylase] ligase [Candidatus Copromonas sp.]
MKGEILKLLKETDGYISGQELCEKFGVSRTAIWKVINQLKEEGYEIEAVRNKGYILKGSADVLSKEELESTIHTKWAGENVVFFEETVSTNNEIRSLAEQGAPHGTLAVAEKQLGGKGRRGRVWTSPAGVGIWMSMLLRPQIDPLAASMLTLVMALAAKKGIEISTGLKSEIKWPNDLVLNKKKICGILTEMSTELMEIQYVIPGIGINVNQKDFPDDIKATATSLYIESGKIQKRSEIIAAIMEAFEGYYDTFIKTQDMSGLIEEYNANLVNLGNEVCVLDPAGEFRGVSEGINKEGALLVRLADGTLKEIISGEVSVRGVYGYV